MSSISDGRGQLFVSYLQIYCEVISDLLAIEPETINLGGENEMNISSPPGLGLTTGVGFNPNHLAIREKNGNVFVEGLSKVRVQCLDDLDEILKRGERNRNTASTNANQTSSRSHAALIIKVIMREEQEGQIVEQPEGLASFCESTLVIVDLAGSER